SMGQLLPPTALLLLVSASMQAADLPKAVVFLDPPWVRVLQEDNVTLKCQGALPSGHNSTRWLHNGNLISSQASSYFIASARVEDSGEYRCQTGLSMLSDPVQLDVHTGWLLLQAPKRVFQEGETIRLRCHSWRNNPVHKVTYLQNGKGKKYFHHNSELYIPEATRNDSGSYFCRGLIGYNNKSSETVNIIVQGPAFPSTSPVFPPWHQIAFCLMMGLLFAVDTGLYFSVQRNLQRSVEDQTEHKFRWSQDPQDK
uniref:Ig-like domain-containing protein n=1 Tax=Sciurus vulgaris TaxID=55149 RepID=A0A8D2D0G2_SCIVU